MLMNNEKKTTNIKDIINFFKISFLVSPLHSILKLFISLLTVIFPIVSATLWKSIIDLLVTPLKSKLILLITFAISYFGVLLISGLLKYWHTYIDKIYYLELEVYAEKKEIESSSSFDLSYYDDSQKQSQNKELSKAYKSSAKISWGLISLLCGFISFTLSLVIVCKYNWWIGIITVLLVIPKYFFSVYINKRNREFNIEISEEQRLTNYYGEAMKNGDVLLDVKLNNASNYFYRKYLELSKKTNKKIVHHKIQCGLMCLGVDVLSNLSFFFVIILTILDASTGTISIGTIQYNWNIVDNLKKQALSIVQNGAQIVDNNKLITLLASFVKKASVIESSQGAEISTENLIIEFEHVTFKYPNTDSFVLNDCSFVINSGEKIGLVGLNGSGKTTIVKLLMRFYDPSKGIIRLNGRNIKEYNINSLRMLFSTMFQENPAYIFMPLRDGIALSNYKQKDNDELLNIASNRSGFSSVLKEKNANYDMILNDPRCIHIENSFDLSGGQWQKLSLARAYFRDTNFFIFDEPSASLDVFAEQKIFDDFSNLSKQKTAILISHRLSNMRFCNKIFVLEEGKIVEQGTHMELLSLNGRYAYLYNLQSQRY